MRRPSAAPACETALAELEKRLPAIGGTIGLDAMFGGPISGASMNPARSTGPALVSGNLHALWLYILAPIAGAALGALAYQLIRAEPTPLLGDAPTPDADQARAIDETA